MSVLLCSPYFPLNRVLSFKIFISHIAFASDLAVKIRSVDFESLIICAIGEEEQIWGQNIALHLMEWLERGW